MSNQNLAKQFEESLEKAASQLSDNTASVKVREPIEVMQVEMPVGNPEIVAKRHRESLEKYPDVKVDDDEYVVVSLRRHNFGLIILTFISMLFFVILSSAWIILCFTPNKLQIDTSLKNQLSMIFLPLIVLSVLCGYIGWTTYRGNRLIITNERAIQFIVKGLFNQQQQAVNLESIEDISFSQNGIMQHLLGFGTIRLSTIGDESTYTFPLAARPSKATDIIGDIVENARENQFISDQLMSRAEEISKQ